MKNGCPFCAYEGPSPILFTTAGAFVIEPINPVVPGHVIVVPYDHVEDFASDSNVSAYTMAAAIQYVRHVGLGDCNLITSRGEAATQTIPHLHVHLVPRRAEDGLALPWSAPGG